MRIMRKYQLDIDKSREVYEYFKDEIKIKECYNNVFNIFTLCPRTFREGKWKIAYGYVEVMAGLFCRHCFIIDENENVLDPTNFAHEEPQLNRIYYVIAMFNDTDEYLSAIEQDDLLPALEKYLRDKDKQAQLWARENGVIFAG